MAEFWALVGNENLKLRRRKLIWIALIVIVVVSLGFSALIGIFTNVLSDFDYNTISDFPDYCKREIEYNQEQLQNTPDPELRASYQTDIYQYRILLDCVNDSGDWRYTTGIAARYAEAKTAGDEEFAARLERLIRADDYLGYYRYLIEETETRYAANPALAEAANAGYRFCVQNGVKPEGRDWRYGTAMEMADALLNLRWAEAYAETNPESMRETLETAKNRYALLQYRLDNNIRVNPGDSFKLLSVLQGLDRGTTQSSRLWDTLNTTLSMTSVVLIFSVILAAGMVASEFGKGTIKFLLITPAARWKILLSKYCALLINTGLFFLVLLVSNILFGILFCGGGDFFLPILTAAGGEIKRSSPILLLLGNYLLEFVGILVMSTLAFMISSLFRNAGAAVGISLLIMYGGNTVNSILALAGADWGRYLIFANINLSQILRGASVFPHQNIGTAVVVLVLHMVVFLWTAFDAFDRKEI